MMILEAALWAPSAANAQPWSFVVIRDSKVKEELQKTMAQVGKTVREQYPEFPWSARKISRDPQLISKVPVLVAVCADLHSDVLQKYAILSVQHKKDIISFSVDAAIQNMILMATALGIGSLWLSPVFTEKIKQVLRIPEPLWLVALVALGYPSKHDQGNTWRHPLEKLVHYDKVNSTPREIATTFKEKAKIKSVGIKGGET
jgi:nitroreductase